MHISNGKRQHMNKSPVSYALYGTSTDVAPRPPSELEFPPLNCDAIIHFLKVVEATERARVAEEYHGRPPGRKLCLKCFDGCDPTNFAREGKGGTCKERSRLHCLRKKLVRTARKMDLLLDPDGDF